MDWLKIGKGVCCDPAYLTSIDFYAEYLMKNARLDESQAGIKISGRNINNLRYADDTTLMAERGTEEPFDEGKGGEWKSWLKTQHSKNQDRDIQSHHFMTNR